MSRILSLHLIHTVHALTSTLINAILTKSRRKGKSKGTKGDHMTLLKALKP